MKANAASNVNYPTGDADIDASGQKSVTFRVPIDSSLAGTSGIGYVETFAEDAHGKLTWGIYSSALTILKSWVLSYPLYADAMYFQIGDSNWGTVGNGYMGLVQSGSSKCYLKGSEAQGNAVPCAMPKDYPNN